MLENERGTGRTSSQMQEAPKDAVYIWVNSSLSYPQALARSIGREDLQIVSPYWLNSSKTHGNRRAVVLDHAADLTSSQWEMLFYIREREKNA